jgi:hypothetical protein
MSPPYLLCGHFDVLKNSLDKSITIGEIHHSFHGIREWFHHKIILKEVILKHTPHPTEATEASHDLAHLLKWIIISMSTKDIDLVIFLSKELL